MVEFGTGYLMPMDRHYEESIHHHSETNDVGVGIGDFGQSIGLGPVPNVQAIKSKLYAGGKKMEFVFTGSGKGSGQGQTPEMYGLKQRQALEEISRANKVDFTTHATVGVYGLAGMNPQQGNFSKESKNFSVQEIKRAIEFAADVAKGGPVVVHTGEFSRPIVDAEWNQKDDGWKGKFRMYDDEEERSSFQVIDTRTGGSLARARKNQRVPRPVWNTAETGKEYTDFDGSTKRAQEGEKIYVDYMGKRLQPEDRTPKYDPKNNRFETTPLDWKDLVQESKEMTARAREIWRDWKSGKLSDEEFNKSNWIRFKDVNHEEDIKVRPEEAYVISTLENQSSTQRGYAIYYSEGFEKEVESVKKLQKAYETYKKIEEATSEEERWKLKQEVPGEFRGLIPSEEKFPSEIIHQHLKIAKAKLQYMQETSASQWAQSEDIKESMRHVESADTYAFKEACDAYAQSAMNAMEHSNRLQKEGKLKKPLAIAMENLFPEHYGAHPDELIKLVHGSRDKMKEILVQRGMNEAEAAQKAQEHITSTFDTGHMNMWRKYWVGDPTKSMAENDADFNKWTLQQVEKMIDANILGHVHLDDNYGYHDDHLAPGEGNTPIKEIVQLMKKRGYKGEMIVEPGADFTTDLGGFHSVMKTWRLFGSPVYGAAGSFPSGRRSWNQVGYGWFGQNEPPYFTFGGYSPSEEWTLWSGVPLE